MSIFIACTQHPHHKVPKTERGEEAEGFPQKDCEFYMLAMYTIIVSLMALVMASLLANNVSSLTLRLEQRPKLHLNNMNLGMCVMHVCTDICDV